MKVKSVFISSVRFLLIASILSSLMGPLWPAQPAFAKNDLVPATSESRSDKPLSSLSPAPLQQLEDLAPPAGLACVDLAPIPMTSITGEKPQSKVWKHDGSWWGVFPTSASTGREAGTWLWKLDDTSWTNVLLLSTSTSTLADIKRVGSIAHILLYAGTNTQLVSVEYLSAAYQFWGSRPTPASVPLPSSDTATIDIDSAGRMWLATENNATDTIDVFYSDSPYSSWSGPLTLAAAVHDDDIAVVAALPDNTVGVLWSNQNSQRFGFKIHQDAAAPDAWGIDEVPAAQSALDVGLGMADDHLNLAVASNGTLYAAVKTSYDSSGYPKVALLVRRPTGVWDDLYVVDTAGTRGIVALDDVNGHLTVLYTSTEGYGNIVYRQTATDSVSFGSSSTLRTGSFNNVSGSKENSTGDLLVIYHSSSHIHGSLCAPVLPPEADLSISKEDGRTTVEPDDTLTYTVRVENHGPESVTGAAVQDAIPANLANPAWTCTGANGGACTGSGAGDIDDLVNLPVGATVTYTLAAQLDAAASGILTNTASVAPPVGVTDPVLTNNSVTDTDTILLKTPPCEDDPTLVGCWKMEEGSGTLLQDGSSFGNDATTVNNPTWVAGRDGYALNLDGSTQYASVPNNSSLDLPAAITLAAWIRPAKPTVATQPVVKKADQESANGYELSLSSNGKAFVRFNEQAAGNLYQVNSQTSYPLNGSAWMHLAATYDGQTMKLYVNGREEGSKAGPAQIGLNDNPFLIGRDGAGQYYFQGQIDDLRVYNRALGPLEIRTTVDLNTPPLAVDDAYTTGEGQQLTLTAPGVLGNDTDPESDPISAVWVSGPAHGVLNLNPDGSFTYTPSPAYAGDDAFIYKANDGLVDSNVATVAITVHAATRYALYLGSVSAYGTIGRADRPIVGQLNLDTCFKRDGECHAFR